MFEFRRNSLNLLEDFVSKVLWIPTINADLSRSMICKVCERGPHYRDLTMGVCFSRILLLLAAVVQLLLWGTVNSFSHKFFDFCRQLPEMEIAFFN